MVAGQTIQSGVPVFQLVGMQYNPDPGLVITLLLRVMDGNV